MASIIADCIISPLGFSTEENLEAVLAGRTGLRRYAPDPSLPFAFTASLFSAEDEKRFMIDGFSRFESLALSSIRSAMAECDVPLSNRTILILSSTKGSVGDRCNASVTALLADSASRLNEALGLPSAPLAICNACVSGVSALILAKRLLDCGEYDYAIVCGADEQSRFIISGFHSLKALDENECRPFDIDRLGLNLGEAAATVILKADDGHGTTGYNIIAGCSRNDGMHITNPSPTGDGCMQSIVDVMEQGDAIMGQIALINAHGTATMYNDQMESKAISRAGMSSIPVNALKGYLGHTMGASGIAETILTMHSLERGIILPTRGFTEIGVSGKIDVVKDARTTDKTDFIKIISGFGGCNCALLLTMDSEPRRECATPSLMPLHRVEISPRGAFVDGKRVHDSAGPDIVTEIYRSLIGDYPRYYKMDSLSRLAFVATELLLQCDDDIRQTGASTRPVVFFSRSGSAKTDAEYISTISGAAGFFPSPALFVYTLPNICAGEVAIRNKYNGETLFVVLDSKDTAAMARVNRAMMCDPVAESLVTGWIEYLDDLNFEVDIHLVIKQ